MAIFNSYVKLPEGILFTSFFQEKKSGISVSMDIEGFCPLWRFWDLSRGMAMGISAAVGISGDYKKLLVL